MNEKQINDFYARHCAMPDGVVVVTVYNADGEAQDLGVFSSLEFAEDWVDSLRQETGEHLDSFLAPYLVDEPRLRQYPAGSNELMARTGCRIGIITEKATGKRWRRLAANNISLLAAARL